jgi:hypothetical protein
MQGWGRGVTLVLLFVAFATLVYIWTGGEKVFDYPASITQNLLKILTDLFMYATSPHLRRDVRALKLQK